MKTIPAYQFDLAGLYVEETEADESPLEPGVFLSPARCTLVRPPESWPSDKWPRWDGSNWMLVVRPSMPEQLQEESPEAKLKRFLMDNPDVAHMITPGISSPDNT